MSPYLRSFRINMAIALVGFVAFLLVPTFFGKGVVFLAGLIMVNIVYAMSWNFLFAGVGLLSFGHAMFIGVGAYTMAYVNVTYPGVPFLLCIAAGAIAGGVLALVFGIVALRRTSGSYFAILTLAFSALVHLIITKSSALGRNDGLVGIRRPNLDFGVFSINLSQGDTYYYFLVVVLGLAVIGLWCITNSRLGRLLQASRQDAMRTAFLGINVSGFHLLAFVLSGCFAALAGAVLAPWSQIASPEIAHWSYSTLPMLFSLLGGATNFWGPAIGAVIFGVFEYGMRTLHGLTDITMGVLLLIVVLAVPGGIAGLFTRLSRRRAPEVSGAPAK